MPALKRQRGRRKIEFFAGLDVSLAETSVCVVDEKVRTIAGPAARNFPHDMTAESTIEALRA
jgi:hypothetical protein